jgi:hypothetical protein
MNDPSERCKWPCCVVIMALIHGPIDRQIKLLCPQPYMRFFFPIHKQDNFSSMTKIIFRNLNMKSIFSVGTKIWDLYNVNYILQSSIHLTHITIVESTSEKPSYLSVGNDCMHIIVFTSP